ncbi:hypothetical protein Tco_0123750 [Tanacetum coccineum]
MYAIDVKPIPHPLKNNRSAHLNYINHLKESVETVREIVEEARVVKPLDNALNYACQYTKLSQELIEYVIGTCPKEFTERDSKAPSIPFTRKKQVTFTDTCSESDLWKDTSITQADLHPSVNPVAGEPSSAQSTSGDVSLAEPNQVNQPPDHLRKWTKDHPLDNIVGNPSRPVSARKQLGSDALW